MGYFMYSWRVHLLTSGSSVPTEFAAKSRVDHCLQRIGLYMCLFYIIYLFFIYGFIYLNIYIYTNLYGFEMF